MAIQIEVRLLKDNINNYTFYGYRLDQRTGYLRCSKENAIKLLANGAKWVGKKGGEPTA